MELPQHYYLGNDGANPFYHFPLPLGYIDGKAIYENDCTYICCLLEDKAACEEVDDIPF